MASSTLSLGSLSSPSPSPSPPPPSDLPKGASSTHTSSAATAQPFRNIDTDDSELSELTDDDQDASAAVDKRTGSSAGADDDPVIHDDDAPAGSPSRADKRGKSHRSSSSRRGGGGRRKRSSIVPAPMWGWVPERPPTALEEEEEEMTEPPRAMEEEEEEEDEEDDEEEEEEEEEEDDYKNGNDGSGHVPQRRPQNPKRVSATHRSRARTSKSASMAVKRHAEEEEEEEESSSYQSSKKKRPARSRVAAVSGSKRRQDDDDAASDDQVPLIRKKGAKSSTNDDEQADGFDEHEGANGGDDTDSETEPSKPPAAPLSPAKLTSGNNQAGLTTALSALAAVADGINPSTGPNCASASASATSSSVIAALSLEQLSNHIPPRSRSDSANSAEGIDNAGSSMSKPKALKVNSKVNRSKPRGKLSPTDKKDMTLHVNGTASNGDSTVTKPPVQSSAPAKKAPPPPLDLKIDTLATDTVLTANGQEMDVDGEEEATNTALEDGMDIDMGPTPREPEEEEEEEEEEDVGDDGDEVSIREEEDVDPIDEEAGDAGDDADEDPLDGDEDPADNDGEDEQDQDQEQDQDPEGVDAEQENEEGDQEEADEEISPGGDADVEDHEGDMQPAHRAEALDVLATIELRFALLRERVYVEKMESLAWEESMVQNGVHPEMIHLQRELSKRRDKRLELASRKRSYEVANATTRRKADEAGLWSWWKAAKATLQTDMISETSRKRRKLERERRASERPPPIRRIPQPFEIQFPPVPPLSLRKIVDKAYPFALKPKKDGRHRHPRPSKNLVYPEINTLSSPDVQADLEYLFHQRQQAEQQQQQRAQHQQSHYSQHPPLSRNGSGIGRTAGMGLPNGNVPSAMQAGQTSMGPPPHGPRMQMNSGAPAAQHNLGMGYEPYLDAPPSWPSGNRIRDPYQSQAASMTAPPLRDNASAFSNYAAMNERSAQGAHGSQAPMNAMQNGHGYSEHEMSTMGPSAPNTTGVGHQILPHHPYFGQGNVGPASNGAPPPPLSGHHERSGHKGSSMAGMNGRRSISPVHAMPNGGPKQPGSWMGSGMGMSNFHAPGNVNGSKAGDWDPRMPHEDDERERMRERDRKRDERDREDRERVRRDREYQELERDRIREHQHMQQQHRAPPPPSAGAHPGSHTHERMVNGPPPQGPGGGPHHPHQHHHHHRAHHHHVVHNHNPGPQHASSSMPTTGGGAPPIVHSPRSTRDYDARPPPGPSHAGPGPTHPTEVIMLSSANKPMQGQRDRESGSWSMKGIDDKHHHSTLDYREREREREMNKDRPENRDSRKAHSGRQSVGPAMPPLDDRADRPLAMPFVMASSHVMQQSAAGMTGGAHPTSSPRGAWNGSAPMDDPSYRPGSSSVTPHDSHGRSPVQGHRYAPNAARIPNSSSSGLPHRMASPPLPSGRTRPPPSPSYSTTVPSTQLQHSPPSSPKMRPLSPPPISASKHIYGPSSGPGFSSSPHLTGPGRTSTPTGLLPPPSSAGHPPSNGNAPPYSMTSRTASPLMASLQGGRPTNGNGADRDRADRDRHALSPRLPAPALPVPPPPKLSAAQMVDGH